MSDADTTQFDLASQYPGYVQRLFQLESGGNPYAVTGSNKGLGQFGPSEEARYGITDANRASYAAQANAVGLEAQEHYGALQRALGRPPTPGELYLAHQQGISGGPALMTAAPDQPAWMAVRPYYKSDRIAQQAITGNIPTGDPLHGQDVNAISSADFRNMWISRFERGPRSPAVAASPGASPPGASGSPFPNLGGLVASYPAASSPPAAAGAFPSAGPQPPTPPVDGTTPTASLTPSVAPSGPAGLAGELLQEPQLQPAPMMQLPVNLARLRNAVASRGGGAGGVPLPPSVAQRIAQLMGRIT